LVINNVRSILVDVSQKKKKKLKKKKLKKKKNHKFTTTTTPSNNKTLNIIKVTTICNNSRAKIQNSTFTVCEVRMEKLNHDIMICIP